MCISVGWLFFLSFFFFFFFLQKVVPTKQWGFFFFLWVSPWTIEGQGLRSHRRLEEETLRYTHAYTQTLTRSHTFEHQVYVSTHTTHMRHGADTHTHTKHTLKFRKATRTKGGKKGLFLFTNILTLVLQMWHTHTSTDSKIHKPSTWMRHWSRTMLHTLGTAKGLETKCKYCTLWYISRG